MARSSTTSFLALATVVLTGAMTGCSSGAADDGPVRALVAANAGSATALAEEELLTVTLDSRPSTGYAWQVDEIDGSVLRLVGRELTASPLLGGTDQEILRFAGVAQGRTSLALFYRRPWDPPGTGERVYRVEVEVEGAYSGPYQAPLPSAPARMLAGAAAASSAIPTRYNACESAAGAYARCTPVKDQGSCGGCWAFATAGVFENALALADPAQVRDLSEQYLISCNTEGWSCDGGFIAFQYYIDRMRSPPESQAGAVYEADFPFTAQSSPCGSTAHPHHEKAGSWAWAVSAGAPADQQVVSIKQAILDHGPVWTTVCADSSLQGWKPSAGTFLGSGCAAINHAVVLVGWDDAGGYWIVRNSWSARWGDQGYLRIAWGANAIGSNSAYVVLQGANQRPQASAGAAQVVDEGSAVALDGSATSDADGSVHGYSWVQTSGPAVVLSGAATARPTFTAPAVSASTVLAFRLTVQDDRGAESSAGTTVTVQHVVPPEPAAETIAPGGVTAGCGTSGAAAAMGWWVLLLALAGWRRRARG